MRKRIALACCLIAALALSSSEAMGDKVTPSTPSVLRDAKTGIVYYLESNGHHVSAINPKGVILWTRDMALSPETGRDIIVRLQISDWGFVHANPWAYQRVFGDPDQYLHVAFGPLFGLIKKSNGDFIVLGQD